MGNMLCHEVEWARDIHSKPSDLVTTFIAQYREFPQEISRKQCHDKKNNIVVGLE
jgi:hypothetical protein